MAPVSVASSNSSLTSCEVNDDNDFLEGDAFFCVPGDSFDQIKFDDAQLSYSNLGGLGGRCDRADGNCLYILNATEAPQEIYYENVGSTSRTYPLGTQIDLRITNETEYRSWMWQWNDRGSTYNPYTQLYEPNCPRLGSPYCIYQGGNRISAAQPSALNDV